MLPHIDFQSDRSAASAADIEGRCKPIGFASGNSEQEALSKGRPPIQYNDVIADPNRPTLQYFGKNAFPGHDAVADLMEDLAPVVTGLADLGDLEPDGVAELKLGADGQFP